VQKRFLSLFYKVLEKIHLNTGVALRALRQHLFFLEYEERDTDIYVATFMKSGTTWMQVILYNMLTKGDMDFNHIYEVSPWPRNEAFNGKTPDRINNLPEPRILKTHDPYFNFNKNTKGKFIFVYRDGKDVAASLYHHNKNYLNPELEFNTNFKGNFMDTDTELNWFKFTREWLINKNNWTILYISYEQLQTDFEPTLEKIARFLQVSLTNEVVENIKRHASFEYMKANEEKFGEIPPISHKLIFNQFIRQGKAGDGIHYMNQEQLAIYEGLFDLTIKPLLFKLRV